MSTFKLKIVTDNEAFNEIDASRGLELARLLGIVAAKVENGNAEGAIEDANGNRVGSFWFEDTEGIEE